MKLLIKLLLLIILIFSAKPALCQLKQEVPFKISRNKTILPVRIGNSRVLNIILDSGMGYDGVLIFNPSLRDSLALINPIEMNIAGAGSGNASRALVSESADFHLGNVEFKNQRIIVLRGDAFKGFPTDGVTGYSILGHYMVEMNYDKNIMTLHNPDSFKTDNSWTEIPIYFKDNNIPWIDVKVAVENEAPVKLSVYIDYASGEAVELLEKEKQKFRIPKNVKEVYLGKGLSGDIYGKKGIISKLIIGPHELKNVDAAFAPAKVRSKQNNADGIIANSIIRRFNLIFDYENKKLYIKPNSHFNEPFQ